jgi:hypothetical protein
MCAQIFSISNNSTLFKQAYKSCWGTFKDCNKARGLRYGPWACYLLKPEHVPERMHTAEHLIGF